MYMSEQKQANYGGGFGSSIAQMANSPEPAQRQHEVPEQICRLGNALEMLEKTVVVLEERLSPVLRPNGPQSTGEAKLAAAPPATGYGTDLYDRVQRTQHATERLYDLLHRLEI